jgi:mono/diheme cytochrome c family protein
MMKFGFLCRAALAAVLAMLGATAVQAADPANGRVIFFGTAGPDSGSTCADCHTFNGSLMRNRSKIWNGANNAASIQFGIATVSDMRDLTFLTPTQLDDLAAYIGPTLTTSRTTLSAPNTAVGASSTSQPATVTNYGINMKVTGLEISGINASDFALAPTATCVANASTLTDLGTCDLSVVFTPSGAGTRNAQLTVKGTAINIAGAAVSSPTVSDLVINLSGSGSAVTPLGLDVAGVDLVWNPTAGTSSSGSVTLTNGNAYVLDVSISSDSGLVTVSGQEGCGTGSTSATIRIPANSACTLSITTSGVVSSASVTFNGGVNVGSQSIAVTAVVPASTGGSSTTTFKATNAGAGGCSLGNPNEPMDPVWPAMTLGALAVLAWRGRVARLAASRVKPVTGRH